MSNFNFNKVILGGRLTADPEIKQTPSAVAVTTFTLAVNRKVASGNNGQPQTDFINCVAWRSTAEFVSRYFKKGSTICIVGSIQNRNWTDQQGQKRYATDVVVDEANFVDSKSDGTAAPATDTAPQTSYPATSVYAAPQTQTSFQNIEDAGNDDDLPF